MNKSNSAEAELNFTYDENEDGLVNGLVNGLTLNVPYNLTDEYIDKTWPKLSSLIKSMRDHAAKSRKNGINNRKVEDIDPIFQFFPDWKGYGRTCIVGDGQQSFFGIRNLIREGKLRDMYDPEKLAFLLSTKVEIVYKAWSSAIDPQNDGQIRFRYSLIEKGWEYKDISVTKNNDTLVGNIDHFVSQQTLRAHTEYGCDTFIFIFGDKDYQTAVDSLISSGKRVIIIGNSNMTGRLMKESATRFIDMEHICPFVYKENTLLKETWWNVFKHDPDLLPFLSEDEKKYMRPIYQRYLKQGGEPSSFSLGNKPTIKEKIENTIIIDRPKPKKQVHEEDNLTDSNRRTRPRVGSAV